MHDHNDIENILIVRSLAGETSAEEEKQLAAWIAKSEENERHFLGLKRAFALGKDYYAHARPPQPDINMDLEWNHFVETVGTKRGAHVRKLGLEPAGRRYWLRIAAAIVLIVASGVLINYFIVGKTYRFQTSDNTLALALPDGTHVVLNRFSKFSYTSHFGSGTRSVNLSGEAFFEVARDPGKPFIITVGDAQVEVLGTSFNVQGYASRPEVSVTVETGTVKLSAPALNKAVKLVAGEKGIYARSQQEVHRQQNDNPNFLSWKTRKIEFRENDLATVVKTINEAYGSHIKINTAVPASCVVTVAFDRQSLEAVLNVLKATLNLTYRTTGDQIEITHAGC